MTPDTSLSGLRILVTRPSQQAQKWQVLLTGAGAAALVAPLLQIVPFIVDGSTNCSADSAAIAQIKQRILNLDEYQHIIFVSQNAVAYGWPWIDQYWPQLPYAPRYYAVGSATAKALLEYDVPVVDMIEDVTAGAMNTEALLALPGLQQLENSKVLIFRGAGGRPLLAEVLQQRGAQVDYCELYQRCFPDMADAILLDNQWGRQRDVVAVHSGESLENWLQVVQRNQQLDWLRLPLLVPSERVARRARQANCTEVIVAVNASDEEMLKRLQSWYRQP